MSIQKTENINIKLKDDDLLILHALEKYGPRIGLIWLKSFLEKEGFNGSYSKLIYRFSKMIKSNALYFKTVINYRKLGLMVTFVKVKAPIKRIDIIENAIKLNPTVVYHARRYGEYNYAALFAIPDDSYIEFRSYTELVRLLGTENLYRQIVDETIYPNVGLGWYDKQKGQYVCDFEKFSKEVLELVNKKKNNLEIKKEEKKEIQRPLNIKLDNLDLKILESLEINAKASTNDIAKRLGVPAPLVTYHFNNHINQYDLIQKYFVGVNPKILMKDEVYLSLHVKFQDDIWRDAFIDVIKDKLIVHSIRFLSDKSILLLLFMPYNGLLPLERLMWDYTKRDIIEFFDMAPIDPDTAQSYTLPYELYKDGRFIYPHEEIMQKLDQLISQVQKVV